MRFQLDTTILVALISAVSALLVAVVTFFMTRRGQTDIENLKAERQHDIETWKATLQADIENLKADRLDRKAERDALRDYEYEARKRLYHQCSPLIFQLMEQAESMADRIRNLALAASQGKLEPGRSWLARKYYKRSTFHRLLGPLATLKVLQNRLTLVDLSLDPHLYLLYLLAREIYRSLPNEFALAGASETPLPYEPHADNAETEKVTNPAVYWQQGIPIGILDNAVDSLIVKPAETAWRVMTLAEFENEYGREDSTLRLAIDRIGYLFEDFHPKTRPVLWRVLLAQEALYRVLLQVGEGNRVDEDLISAAAFPKSQRALFDWRQKGEHVPDAEVLEAPFDAAAKYLRNPLTGLMSKFASRRA